MNRIRYGVMILAIALLAAVGTPAKDEGRPIKILMSPSSTVPRADVVRNLLNRCPNVTVTLEPKSSDFMLEAGGWSGAYKFTVFKHGGEAVYSTSTVTLGNAVKDVCKYVNAYSPK
jgi:hypothetical protein